MRFYVYELIDPRDGAVFYVGKGQRGRVSQHTRDAIAGRRSNQAKHDRILSILDAGLVPMECIVARFDDEHEAIAYEAHRIAEIGLDYLTNVLANGAPQSERAADTMRRLIAECHADIARQQSTEIVEFAREGLELAEQMLERLCR